MDPRKTTETDATTDERATRMTRRQLLQTAGAGLVVLLPMLPALTDTALAAPAQWTPIGPAKKFVKGQPQRVVVAGGGVLFVTRLTQTQLLAVSAKCTHKGCEVGWSASDHYLHCPCHGAVFGASGKNVHGTTRRPDEPLPALTTVPIRQQGGQVQINLAAVAPDDLVPRED